MIFSQSDIWHLFCHYRSLACRACYICTEAFLSTFLSYYIEQGTFALENALMKGATLHKEVSVLCASVEGIDKDSLLDVALSSLPPETLTKGTKTQAQLHQKVCFCFSIHVFFSFYCSLKNTQKYA